MCTRKFNEFNLTSLVQGLKSDQIVLVEIGLLDWENCLVSLELMEPGCFFGIDHSVIGEHNEHCLVETGESIVDSGIKVLRFLIV